MVRVCVDRKVCDVKSINLVYFAIYVAIICMMSRSQKRCDVPLISTLMILSVAYECSSMCVTSTRLTTKSAVSQLPVRSL